MDVKSILLCGVGGQGILLASDILAGVCMEAGYDVKKSEVHGMSQRGGSVISGVRFGDKVYSPLIGKGGADILLAFEKLEAVRNIEYLKPDGFVVVNNFRIDPMPVASGTAEYPKGLIEKLKSWVENVVVIDGLSLAKTAGNPRSMNIVLLGALAKRMDIPKEVWLSVIEKRVPPKTVEINKKAFELGYAS